MIFLLVDIKQFKKSNGSGRLKAIGLDTDKTVLQFMQIPIFFCSFCNAKIIVSRRED